MSSVFRWLTPVFIVLAVFGLVSVHRADARVVTQHEVFALASSKSGDASVLSRYSASARYIAQVDDLSITASSTGKIYTESAENGDGTTHLARKAIAEYVRDRAIETAVTRAQRVYAEDFLKDQYGEAWLALGETRTFSAEALDSALDNARAIDPMVLDQKLAPYVANVDWSYYETLQWQSVNGGSSATLDQQPVDDSTSTDGSTDGTSSTDASSTTASEKRDLNPGWILVILLAVILILGMYFYLQARNDEFRLPEMDEPKSTTTKTTVTTKVVEPAAKPTGTPAKPAVAMNQPKPVVPGKPVTPAPSLNPNAPKPNTNQPQSNQQRSNQPNNQQNQNQKPQGQK